MKNFSKRDASVLTKTELLPNAHRILIFGSKKNR